MMTKGNQDKPKAETKSCGDQCDKCSCNKQTKPPTDAQS